MSIDFPVEPFYRKLKNKAKFTLISFNGFRVLKTSNSVFIMKSLKNKIKNFSSKNLKTLSFLKIHDFSSNLILLNKIMCL